MSNKIYSAEDIQRYLKGQMSAEEMHALETSALDDPFLADAIDGYQTVIAEGKEKQAIEVLHQLKNPKPQAKVIPIRRNRWWQIAAAAAIVLITGLAIFLNNKPEQQKESLAVKQPDGTQTPAPEGKFEDGYGAAAATDSSTQMDTNALVQTAPSRKISGKSKTTPDKKDEAVAVNQEQAKETADKVVDEIVTAPAKSVAREIESANPGVAVTRSAESTNVFSGKVVDAKNKPIANATINVLNREEKLAAPKNLVTDASGNFRIPATDSVLDIQVAMVGYEQKNFRLSNSPAQNNLVLPESNAKLDEVVVVGYGQRNKRSVGKTVTVQDAVPLVGWVEYEKYLRDNKKVTTDTLLKGDAVVSFLVTKSGELKDFKVEKSLAPVYDKEAIRLVKEGPAWKLLKGRRTRITVMVSF